MVFHVLFCGDLMRAKLARFDVGFLVVVAICLVAIWPFVSRPGMPLETDAELHIFRLAELSRLVQGGAFYPRWSPNFYYGYGYPIYNYYAPLTYYVGLPVALLPFSDPVVAVKFVFVLGLLLAGLGMYGFVRDSWGRPAGYVAAAAYVYAPYILYVDPHARGDLAEAFSFAMFPLALWALHRTWQSGRGGPWLAAVLAVAAVILTHNLMAMVFFAMLVGWVAWQFMLHYWPRPEGRTPAGRLWLLPLALLLGVGTAAFFWLPVALEQNAVNLSSLIGDGSHFDFRNHFLTIGQLLDAPQRLDWGATEQAFVLSLGLAQWLLGGLGAVLVLAGRVRQRGQALFFLLAALLLIFLMSAPAAFLWERVPLLPYLQFPWRLLGPAVAMLAVLAGVGVSGVLDWLPRRFPGRGERWAGWVPAGVVGFTMLLALPLTQMPPWPAEFGGTGRKEVVDIELTGRWLGTTATADFVPATVEVLPLPNNAVLWNFWTNEPLERLNRATIPRVATVTGGEVSPLHFRYQVDTPKAFPLRFFVFDFPGWQARIDGQVVPKELGLPEGFIVVPLPAGRYTVDLEFVNTPVRSAAWLIAGLSLVVAVAAAWWLWRRPLVAGSGAEPVPPPGRETRPLLAMSLGLALLLAVALEPLGWLHLSSSGYTALPATEQVYADFGGQIALIGYDAPAEARPGETIPITLYWQAQQPLQINYQVFVHLLLPDGRTLVAQSDKLNPAGFPTRRWPTDKYVRDEHELTIPAGTPPGTYLLTTGLWVQTEGWRLPLLDANGQQIGDNYQLRELTIR